MSTHEILVGSTGLVGGNLLRSHEFDLAVHSTDISQAYSLQPDLLVYAGVTGTAFLADANPQTDLTIVETARENIRRINARQTVLISSVNVYSDSRLKDENSPLEEDGLGAYGTHRRMLENWVREDFTNTLIVRLPAIYGEGLKKNFVHDLINPAPPYLSKSCFEELSANSNLITDSYDLLDNGFYGLRSNLDITPVIDYFSHNPFNALSFTDSRSRYQFYNLAKIWKRLQWCLEQKIELFNVATPPVSAAEVVSHIDGYEWENFLDKPLFDYDMRSIYCLQQDGSSGYLCTSDDELNDLKTFVLAQREKLFDAQN